MADALPTLAINIHPENVQSRRALPENEIERAVILLPEHTAICSDPGFVAVVWSLDSSNRTSAQVLGCQRRWRVQLRPTKPESCRQRRACVAQVRRPDL